MHHLGQNFSRLAKLVRLSYIWKLPNAFQVKQDKEGKHDERSQRESFRNNKKQAYLGTWLKELSIFMKKNFLRICPLCLKLFPA